MHLCSECGKYLSSRFSLNRHMIMHSNDSKFKCLHCNKSFGSKDHLEGHNTSEHKAPKRYTCLDCKKTFVYKKNLVCHRRKCAKLANNREQYVCETCQKTFKKKKHLKQHMAVHSDPEFNCEKCGKLFIWKVSFKKHAKQCHRETEK